MIPNYKNLIKTYGGKWVVLSKDFSEVLASGNKADVVYKKAKETGVKIPNIFKVPQKYIPYIG